MGQNPIIDNFPPQFDQNWAEVARQELEGNDPLEKLLVEKAGLKIKPYYTASDLPLQASPQLTASPNPYLGARNWHSLPRVLVEDEKKANQEALTHLANGADGIYFEMKGMNLDPRELLNGIQLNYCLINFLVTENSKEFLNSFHAYAEQKFDRTTLQGNIFWDNPSSMDFKLIQKFDPWLHFRSCGIVIAEKENVTEEISGALLHTLDVIEKSLENKSGVEIVFRKIAFTFSIGSDLFLSIAKLKALRNLFAQIEGAYGLKTSSSVFIHANSKPFIREAYQPHGNLIKETYAALAAILGGCDGLTIDPEDPSQNLTNRMARNASNILREESFLSKVADPLAGSYFIEALIQQLSMEAWKKFQLTQ